MKKMNMKKIVALATAVVMAFGLTACGGATGGSSASGEGSAQTESAESGALTEVKMYAINDPQMSAAHYVALAKGFYEEEGLDVKTEVVSSGPDLASFVASGKNIYAMGTTYNLLGWVENDVTVRAVAPLCNIGGTQNAAFRKGLEITEANVKDLEGSTVGMVPGAEAFLAFQKFCDEYSLDKESFTYVNLSATEQVAAMSSGDIDMMICWEPHVTNSVLDGASYAFSGTKNFVADPVDGADVNWAQIYTCLMCSEDVIASESETVSKLMRALSKATDFINSNRDEAIEILAPIYDLDSELCGIIMNENGYEFGVTANFKDAMSVVTKFALEENVTTQEYSEADYADWSILTETLPDKIVK